MRLVLQRVTRARVSVAGEEVAAIGRGLLILAGVEKGDGPEQVAVAARKVAGLRLFEDQAGRMNLDLAAVRGTVLLVSQFTLAASLSRGRRPSFDAAAPPEVAEPLIEELGNELEKQGVPVATGRFGADMEVELVNDGPVALVLDVGPEGRIARS